LYIKSETYPAAKRPGLPPKDECVLQLAGCRVLERSLRLLLEGLHRATYMLFFAVPHINILYNTKRLYINLRDYALRIFFGWQIALDRIEQFG
jgi:hypothetical protein